MSLLHYIDNEVPAFGEWDSVVTAGGGTIVQSADASFPDRGSYGLRASGGQAYVQKDMTISVDPGGEIFIGWWRRIVAHPAANWTTRDIQAYNAAQLLWRDYPLSTGTTFFYPYDDAGIMGGYVWTDVSGWAYFVLASKRATTNVASDGRYRLYVDGILANEWAAVDNYDRLTDVTKLQMGQTSTDATFVGDSDEVKIATTYPEPFAATPTDEYPQAARTVVLFRQGNADSREFADYCCSELDIPLANRCPLPNATGNESLADYATFQTEVETDLAAWLALNTTAAANCSCFLIGHGVPGYFTSGGVKHSATSRLMNYGTAFSSQTTNPLYNPATVARLTKTALGGKYLAIRIDFASVALAKNMIDLSLTVAALSALPATDKLYSDETTYRASLACQHLRIITAALGTFAADAFVWGDTGTPAFGDSGSRAVFCDDSADSASLLRSGAAACRSAIDRSGPYAAALGNSETADTFDAESFFEMLRIGGTLAEAFAVAVANLDYTSVAVGSPLMTVAFQLGGYNAYRHAGGIDWDDATIVAYLRAGVSLAVLAGLGHVADAVYYYGVRAVSDSGVEETGTAAIVRVMVDAAGALVGPPPNAINSAWAEAVGAGKIRLHSYYKASGAAGAATGVQVALVTAGVPDWSTPLQTISVIGSKRINVVLNETFTDGQTVRLAVRAVTAAGVAGKIRRLNPVVADSSAPADVGYAEGAQI